MNSSKFPEYAQVEIALKPDGMQWCGGRDRDHSIEGMHVMAQWGMKNGPFNLRPVTRRGDVPRGSGFSGLTLEDITKLRDALNEMIELAKSKV